MQKDDWACFTVFFLCIIYYLVLLIYGRHGGVMVSALVLGSSGPGSSNGQGTLCCVLGQDTFRLSECLYPPRSMNGYR